MTLLAINLHAHLYVNLALNRVLDSMATCSAIVGVILALSPLISPLILQSPVRQLPRAEEVGGPRRAVVVDRDEAPPSLKPATLIVPDGAVVSP